MRTGKIYLVLASIAAAVIVLPSHKAIAQVNLGSSAITAADISRNIQTVKQYAIADVDEETKNFINNNLKGPGRRGLLLYLAEIARKLKAERIRINGLGAGRTLTAEFDPSHGLAGSVTITNCVYDAQGHIISQVSNTTEYDVNGDVLHTSQRISSYSYNAAGDLTSKTDIKIVDNRIRNDFRETYIYDNSGNLTTKIITQNRYDSEGLPMSSFSSTANHVYDESGKVVHEEFVTEDCVYGLDFQANRNKIVRIKDYSYNNAGLALVTQDHWLTYQNGVLTGDENTINENTYGEDGQILTQHRHSEFTAYYPVSSCKSVSDDMTVYEYQTVNGGQKITKKTFTHKEWNGDPLPDDSNLRNYSRHIDTYTYYDNGKVKTEDTYYIDGLPGDDLTRQTQTTYDSDGNIIVQHSLSERYMNGQLQMTDEKWLEAEYNNGHLVSKHTRGKYFIYFDPTWDQLETFTYGIVAGVDKLLGTHLTYKLWNSDNWTDNLVQERERTETYQYDSNGLPQSTTIHDNTKNYNPDNTLGSQTDYQKTMTYIDGILRAENETTTVTGSGGELVSYHTSVSIYNDRGKLLSRESVTYGSDMSIISKHTETMDYYEDGVTMRTRHVEDKSQGRTMIKGENLDGLQTTFTGDYEYDSNGNLVHEHEVSINNYCWRYDAYVVPGIPVNWFVDPNRDRTIRWDPNEERYKLVVTKTVKDGIYGYHSDGKTLKSSVITIDTYGGDGSLISKKLTEASYNSDGKITSFHEKGDNIQDPWYWGPYGGYTWGQIYQKELILNVDGSKKPVGPGQEGSAFAEGLPIFNRFGNYDLAISYKYDDAGNLVQVTATYKKMDANGNIISYFYADLYYAGGKLVDGKIEEYGQKNWRWADDEDPDIIKKCGDIVYYNELNGRELRDVAQNEAVAAAPSSDQETAERLNLVETYDKRNAMAQGFKFVNRMRTREDKILVNL